MKRLCATVAWLSVVISCMGQGVSRIGGVSGGGGGGGSVGFGLGGSGAADEIRQSADNPVTVRPQALSQKLAASIFGSQISSMYAKVDTNTIVQTHRWRYMGDHRWERDPVGSQPIQLLQHIDGCRYRAESLRWHSWQSEFVSADEDAFVVDLQVAREDKTGYRPMTAADKNKALMVDGQRLILAKLENTGEVYSYTSVLGAKTTVRVMRGLLEFLPISYDDFTRAVSSGQSFDFLMDKKVKCYACKGRGTRPKTQEDRGRIGNSLCPTCKGKKEFVSRVLHRVTR